VKIECRVLFQYQALEVVYLHQGLFIILFTIFIKINHIIFLNPVIYLNV